MLNLKQRSHSNAKINTKPLNLNPRAMTAVKELAPSQDIQQNLIFPPGDLYSDEPPAEQEAQRAEQEAQRPDRLAAKLRELNIDPDTI
jgi:hypothetical protein